MGRTVAKLCLFFVVGAMFMAFAIEGAARIWAPELPPLELLTGAVPSAPNAPSVVEVNPASLEGAKVPAAGATEKAADESTTNGKATGEKAADQKPAPTTPKVRAGGDVRRVVWLSPHAPDLAELAKTMSAALDETVAVTHVGNPHDTPFGLRCRFRQLRSRLRPQMVVVDTSGVEAPRHLKPHALDAPCVFDTDDIARTRLPPAPWDEALRWSVAYQFARVDQANAALPQPEPYSFHRALDAIVQLSLELQADPIVFQPPTPPREGQPAATDAGEGPAYLADRRVRVLASSPSETGKVAKALVDHVRERTLLLKTSAAMEVLKKDAPPRQQLAQAAEALGEVTIDISGVRVTKELLLAAANSNPDVSLTKDLRERTRRPVDVADFISFLDDALAQAYGMQTVSTLVLTPGRARRVGVFVHPDEVFKKNRPREYPAGKAFIPITEPQEPEGLIPAKDGERLGPNWYLRFENPETEAERMRDLIRKNPKFGRAVKSLVSQLRRQGAEVSVESTVRAKERGYLMWGAFWLSRADDDEQLKERIALLKKYRRKWKLDVDINWDAGDFESTVRAAREMADTYGVVYATRRGAEKSDHYDGDAVDISVVGLPSRLRLRAPRRRARVFDLSGDDETRDLSLSPQLVKYIERAFKMKKLKSDYPHWSAR